MTQRLARPDEYSDDTSTQERRAIMTTDLQQAPKLPPFNSTLSMKAMCVAQATEALRAELKLTPAECIAIEMEMATRIHRKPALAHAKFAEMAADIAVIMPWFETFLELLRTAEAEAVQ
jgi:hypothetical protein